ncbi:MAG: TetR family transcriptional regulator, partial [Desulfobacula sp.]|nr:TetR family transcriptional regulator [Desulfobacula sp.]
YNHTGIQEILTAAGVPKGSFYFYFNNKEDFGLHVIDFFNDMLLGMVEPVLNDRNISPLRRLENLFDFFIETFKTLDYTCGCPIGNLSQEMGDLSPAFSAKLTEAVKLLVNMYKDILDEALHQNLINKNINTEETADFIVSSWHGALIRMKIVKGVEPLELHKRFILNSLQYPAV